MEVLVFGSAIVDFICYVQRFPNPGETIHGNRFSNGFGGKGANQCVAAAKLGAKTALIAKVGNDNWGKLYLDNLLKESVNVDYVRLIDNNSTGIAQITVADTGENSIVIVSGANKLLSVNDVQVAKDLFEHSKVLICQLESPIDATLEALKLFKGISILNAAPATENMSIDLLKLATIFCVNEIEAGMITKMKISGIVEAAEATRELVELGGNIVIITLGENGTIFSSKDDKKIFHLPIKQIKAVDTTGAGDSFIGSLAFLIARYPNESLIKKIVVASEIASISVQKLGTQSSFPSAHEIDIDFPSKKCVFKEIFLNCKDLNSFCIISNYRKI